jgi:hypothetical protein
MLLFQIVSFLTLLVGIVSSSNKVSDQNSNGLPSTGKTVDFDPNEEIPFEKESTANQFALLYQHHKNVIRVYKKTGRIFFATRRFLFPICELLFLHHQSFEKRWALFAEMEKFVHSEPNFISFLIILYFDNKGNYDYEPIYLDIYSDILRKRDNSDYYYIKGLHSGSLYRLQSLAKKTPKTSLLILCSIYNSILMHCEQIFRTRAFTIFDLNLTVFYDLKECRDFGMGAFPIEPKPKK